MIRKIPIELLITFFVFGVLSPVFGLHFQRSSPVGISQDAGWSGSADGACSLSEPTPISPAGGVSPTPTYTWTAVAGAEQYQLWVDDSGAVPKIKAWYTAAQAACPSGTGTCSVTPTIYLTNGPAQFSVRAWASCDGGIYGPWSVSMRFTVGGDFGSFITQVFGLYPVYSAALGGSAILTAQVQNNFSAAMPSNAAVSFHVLGEEFDSIVGSTTISGLTPGRMSAYSFEWTIPRNLIPGTYFYRARVYIDITAISYWSSWQNFTISAGGGGDSLAQVTQIFPVDDASVGGSATLVAVVANIGSQAFPEDCVVRFWVSDVSNNWVGSTPVAGLPAGARKAFSFIWHISADLAPGKYAYYAQVFRGSTTAISEWSSGMEFLIQAGYFRAQVMQIAPVTGAAAGGPVVLRADVKNTGTLPLPANAAVWFWVSGLANNWVGSISAAGLGPGANSWYTLLWQIPPDLATGSYTCYVQVWTSDAISEWSNGQDFQISGVSMPGKATLIFPSGTIATPTPTYRWNAVSDATWYYLWVGDSTSGERIRAWYQADQVGCASGNGVCSVTLSIMLEPGICHWWVQTWNDAGYGPWSDEMQFTVASSGPPSAAILKSPVGTTATAVPTYTWYAVTGSAWYLLWVNDSASLGKINTWYTAEQAGCGSGMGTCSMQPETALAPGTAPWWIQTWNNSGAGPWSSGLSFTVDTSDANMQ